MNTKLGKLLVELADELDNSGEVAIAAKIDEIIKKVAQNYPTWNAQQNKSKELTLFDKYKNKEITLEQYKIELKKLQEQEKTQNEILH